MTNEIVALLSDVVYRISHVSSGAMQIVHVNRLKKYHVRPGRLQMVLEEDESDDQDDG